MEISNQEQFFAEYLSKITNGDVLIITKRDIDIEHRYFKKLLQLQ